MNVHFPGKANADSATLPPGPYWLSVAIAVIAAVCMAVLVEHIHRIEQDRIRQADRNVLIQQAATVRARIEAELSASLYAATGLVGYVVAHEDFLDAVRVNAALEAIYRHGRHLRNVALAPDNVLSYVYPLQGNEAVVGFNYEASAEQWAEVERAIGERNSVLAGPLDLVQGGRGLINRTPVFLLDDRYWGLLSVVIDPDSLFGHVVEDMPDELRFGLRWLQSEQRGTALVGGDASIFEAEHVSLVVPVPGGQWELAVAGQDVTGSGQGYLNWYRAGGHLVALLVAILLMLVLRERWAIARMAMTDQLTGLPNRRAFQRQLTRAMSEASRRGDSFALVYIDLDGFKAVNDRAGHAHGDRVLVIVSRRMRQALDSRSTLARIGGDEFVLLLPDTQDEPTAKDHASHLRNAIRRPIEGVEPEIQLDAAVGVALFPTDGRSAEALINKADSRMYRAKARFNCSQSSPQPR